jgi:hypothetical protein
MAENWIGVPHCVTEGPLPSRILDMHSVDLDLQLAHLGAERIRNQMSESGPAIEMGLTWAGCLIFYRRCFTDNRGQTKGTSRWRIPLDWLDADHRAHHDSMFQLADKHIAHRSDLDAEQLRVGVVLAPPGELPRVTATGLFGIRYAGPTVEDAGRFMEVVETLGARVQAEIQIAKAELEERARALGIRALTESLRSGRSVRIAGN